MVKVGTVVEIIPGSRPHRVRVEVDGEISPFLISETVQMTLPELLKPGHEVVVDYVMGLGLILGSPLTGANYVGDEVVPSEMFDLPHGSVVLGSGSLGDNRCFMVEPYSDADEMTVLNDGHSLIRSTDVDEVPSWLSYKLIWLGES